MDRLAKSFQAVHLLENIAASAQIDPGKELQKTGRRIIAAGHEHRDNREPFVTGLPHQSKLALILLGVAKSMASDKDGDSVRAADRIFERGDPAKARTQFASVKKGVETLGAQPAIQLCCRRSVATGVAQENVEANVASHSASLSPAEGGLEAISSVVV